MSSFLTPPMTDPYYSSEQQNKQRKQDDEPKPDLKPKQEDSSTSSSKQPIQMEFHKYLNNKRKQREGDVTNITN